MTYALVGSGKVATTLAIRFERSGIPLRFAPTHEPTSKPNVAEETFTSVRFTTFAEATDADVVILAAPFWSHRTIARERLTWHGQIVVDAMHAVATLDMRMTIDVLPHGFAGARVVKAFDRSCSASREVRQVGSGPGPVAYLAGDDVRATKAIANLATSLGYLPVIFNEFASHACPASVGSGASMRSRASLRSTSSPSLLPALSR